MGAGGGDLPDRTPVLVTRSSLRAAWRRLAEGRLHAARSPQDEAPAATTLRGTAPARPPGARQKLYVALRRGATLNAAAAQAGVDLAYAEIMCDEMKRQGLLDRAESLCASGLGACGGGTSDEVKIHCAGCPILPLKVS
ncbi:hypothetical protein [Schaalia canis]|uniref:hypothetical protein n=1 Tax=Schaalia canis TaxID=100469 RepID=UPI001F0C3DC4|nr:hypothetical protein [Schaalia canis]